MKTIFTTRTVALLVATLYLMTSCSHSLHFIPSTVVPGAEGKVHVKKDKNHNYAISVNVNNLADASLLKNPRANYVVWMETDNGTQNLGQLTTSHGLFSKAKKASLETVTPHRPLRFLITAEDKPDAQYPNSEIVLTSESNVDGRN